MWIQTRAYNTDTHTHTHTSVEGFEGVEGVEGVAEGVAEGVVISLVGVTSELVSTLSAHRELDPKNILANNLIDGIFPQAPAGPLDWLTSNIFGR
eukprot:1177596-Prorocentrum_minimum.AAC.4